MLPGLSNRTRLVTPVLALCASLLGFASAPSRVQAQVVRDASLVSMGTVSGPDYTLDESDGVVAGTTLYLSLDALRVNAAESLTIDGPPAVRHVVVRVTGGTAALFEGPVTLNIAGATLIIASPAGLTVSDDGVFSVPSDLVLTTADYVRASTGDRFQAPPLAGEVLPDTAPTHLGFLAGPTGTLVVAKNHVSLMGDLRLVAGSVSVSLSSLSAHHVAAIGASVGELNLATLDVSSMPGAGEVRLTDVSVTSTLPPVVLPAGCGNGFVDSGEGCDLGDNNSDTAVDGCRMSCQPAGCGDSIRDTGEVCDNGALNSDTMPGACRSNCTYAICGDGVRVAGERCDDGASNSDTIVDACRLDCQAAGCGDGVVDTGEECDEGQNNSAGAADACREDCTLPRCGDRVVDRGEVCDDGPFNSNDTPERCRVDCLSANGPLELVGGACDVPHHARGEWPLGVFVLAAVAILVSQRRRTL